MRRLRAARRGAPILVAAALAACAQPVKGPPAVTVGGEPTPPFAAFEQRHRDKAMALAREGRWGEAEVQWDILALLRPEVEEYRRQGDGARARVKSASDARLQSAAEARRRGNADQASLLYLKALSLDPANPVALQALRQIEKERALRGNGLKPARAPAMPRPAREATPAVSTPAPDAAERRDLDYGVMLFHQGEYASSVRTLEAYLKNSPRDELGRRYLARASIRLGQQRLQQGKREEAVTLFDKAGAADAREAEAIRDTAASLRKALADEYYEQGVRAYNSDIRQAIDAWERCLKYDPRHLNARLRLQQARQSENKLRALEGSR